MGTWEGRYCDCGTKLPDNKQSGYRIAGKEVCAECWCRPRQAPSLRTFPPKPEVLISGEV